MKKNIICFLLLLGPSSLFAQHGTWEWVTGTNALYGLPVYGMRGVPAPNNTPGAVYEPAEWTDLQGNLWIIGGIDGQSYATLWKFDPVIEQWAWMNGDTLLNVAGVYGTQGVPSPLNFPGARSYGANTWTDLQGNLWLSGGTGFDINGALSTLNDLWKYDISTNEWTWMRGSSTGNSPGNNGTLQVPSPSNEPGCHQESSANWVSNSGDLWMYSESDLWRYTISTNMWTWMSSNPLLSYGTQFVAAPGNSPGPRWVYAHWKDAAGNFWFFGGYNMGAGVVFNDMWKFDPVSLQWTWMGGNSFATFTQQCQANNGCPAKRFEDRACWTDACGRFWNFGGASPLTGSFNDLWFFDPATNLFTWVTDSIVANQSGIYGTKGVASLSNYPPSLPGSVGFMDNLGNMWLFGGMVYNTLWKYVPDPTCFVYTIPNVTANANSNSGCAPFSVQFSSSAPAGVSYQWDFGDAAVSTDTSSAVSPSYTYTNAGTFTVTLTVTSTGACSNGQATATTAVTVNIMPVANAGADQQICQGDTIQLNASGGMIYNWSPGNGLSDNTIANPMAAPAQTTAYIVSINNGPCSDQDTVTVDVLLPPSVVLSNNTTIEPGDSVQLSVSGGTTYQWFPAAGLSCTTCANPVAIPTVTTDYCATVTDSGGCSAMACTLVTVELNCGELFVPNALSPNDDGQNDVLYLRFKPGCFNQVTFAVYDRWGEKVFETNDASTGWDGFFRGQKANVGVYIYTVDAIKTDGTHQQKKGNVSLIR